MSDLNVSLKIKASAEGADKVRGIADDIEALGGSAQDVRDKARALGDQIAAIGDKQGQITSFRALNDELKATQAAMEAAKAKAENLQAQYESAERPTKKLAMALRNARAESERLTAAHHAQRATLNQHKGRMEAAGISTDRLSEAEGRLRQEAGRAAMQLHALTDAAGVRLAAAQLKAADAADKQAMAMRRIKADSAAGELKRLRDAQASSASGSDKLAASIAHAGHSMAGFVAAAAGMSGLADMARNTVDLADRYGMLSARVKLATESEQEHAAAMAGLFEIAQRNSASLEGVSELYGKVAVSVREMGGSQADALALTEAVSQSMRLSGASASAAEGAILQLGQALASGALRGDEFNSIAEASPRLMQALADGLGVARGELRAMAEQGKLTAEVVTKALLSQKEALEAEYQQLPDTVGAAMQRLRNEWMRMVGEFDQANGVTSSLASGIGLLTRHLDDLAAVAGAVGGAVAAGLAVKGGEAMLKFAGDLAAATEKAGGLRAAINSIPTSIKIGVALAGAEIVMANLDTIVEALARNSQAAKDAEAAQERANQQLLEGQRAAIAQAEGYRQYADTVVLSARQVAALSEDERARYQQGIEGATAYEKAHLGALLSAQALGVQVDNDLSAARERMAELRQGAEDLRLGLEIAARGGADLYAQAERLVDAAKFAQGLASAIGDAATQGKEAAGKIDAIIGALNLLQPAHVDALAQAMRTLREQSAQAADLLANQLNAAIEKMSAADLAQFAQTLRAAFDDGKLAAEDFARINDQILAASFDKLGIAAETALGRISPAAGEAISSLDGIRTAVADAADSGAAKMQALGQAVGAAIGKADTLAAVESMRGRIEAMGRSGELSAGQIEQLNRQLAEQKLKVEQGLPGINSLAEAYKILGVTAQAELQRIAAEHLSAFQELEKGKAPLVDLQNGFMAYAASAIKANGGVADAALLSRAAVLGLRDAVVDIELSALKASPAMQELDRRYRELDASAAKETQSIQLATQANVAAARAALEAAKAKGDQNEIVRATVQLAEAEAQAAEHVAQAKQIEADAAQQKVSAVRDEVLADGELTEAENRLLEATTEVAQQKQAEADAVRAAAAAKREDAMAAAESARTNATLASSIGNVSGAAQVWSVQAEAAKRGMEGYTQAALNYWNSLQGPVWENQRAVERYLDSMGQVDAALARANSSAADGVAALQFRLIELNGTEEQIAQARAERDRAEVERQIKTNELLAQRAALEGDATRAAALREENKHLAQQIVLLDQIAAAEKRKRAEQSETQQKTTPHPPANTSPVAARDTAREVQEVGEALLETSRNEYKAALEKAQSDGVVSQAELQTLVALAKQGATYAKRYNVRIDLPGVNGSLVTDDAGAQALLKQLETLGARS